MTSTDKVSSEMFSKMASSNLTNLQPSGERAGDEREKTEAAYESKREEEQRNS